MRVALGGIHIESSIFTPYRSGEGDFRVKRESELVNSYPWITRPASWPALVDTSNDWVGLVHARALPGGIVKRDFFDSWWDKFFTKLNNAHEDDPVDVLLLDIHGAMTVEGINDAEGLIAKKCRQILGPRTTISATMDLHGNVSDLLFESCDLLTAYRTAPHIDSDQTRFRALQNGMLHHRSVQNGNGWYKAKADVPILLSGERTSTVVEPGKSLYASIDDYVSGEGVADVAIWMGFPWADEERNHGAVVSVGADKGAVKRAVVDVATRFLRQGNNFDFVGPVDSVKGAISKAFSDGAPRPFFISDTGDNPGAGGTNDSTDLLEPLYKESLDSDLKILFASIYDPETVEICLRIGEGGKFCGFIGAKLDEFSTPLRVVGEVKTIVSDPKGGKTVVLKCGAILIIITEKRNQYTEFKQFELLDLDISYFDIVAVKIGYLEPDLAKISNGWVMALSTGAVNQDLTTLTYENLRHPMIPFEQVDTGKEISVNIVSTGIGSRA